MKKNKNIIAIEVKKHRRKYSLNQDGFALRAGIGLSTLRGIEQGKKTVKLSSILTVLNALDLEIKIEEKYKRIINFIPKK